MLSLLVISRLFMPQLTDDALSELDYSAESEGALSPIEAPVMLASLAPGFTYSGGHDASHGCSHHHHPKPVRRQRRPALGFDQTHSKPRGRLARQPQTTVLGRVKEWFAVAVPGKH